MICELTGEDIFLEALAEEDRRACQKVIREAAPAVAAFVATSRYYAAKMAAYLGVDAEQVAVVYPGVEERLLVREEELAARALRKTAGGGVVGYMARVCPEKGLRGLLDAVEQVRGRPGLGQTRLLWGGYLAAKDAQWHEELVRRAAGWGEHRISVEWDEKLALLERMDVLSVPGVYPEPKGIYLLEAWRGECRWRSPRMAVTWS